MKNKLVDKILGQLDWQEAWKSVPPREHQIRYEDDSVNGTVSVIFTRDGDAWIDIFHENRGVLRFREPSSGGGSSPRVRAALMVLALAIKADNEEHPQNRS